MRDRELRYFCEPGAEHGHEWRIFSSGGLDRFALWDFSGERQPWRHLVLSGLAPGWQSGGYIESDPSVLRAVSVSELGPGSWTFRGMTHQAAGVLALALRLSSGRMSLVDSSSGVSAPSE